MSQKLKKLLASVLVVGVGVVWIPQIYAAVTKVPPPKRAEIPALGTDAMQAASVAPLDASVALTADSSTGGTDSADLARSLESSLAKAKRLLPEKSGLDLDKLSTAWATPAPVEAPVQAPQTVVTLDPTPTATTGAPLVVDLAPVRDPIDDFLGTHPLEGTLIGASRRLACLGPLLLSVGDEPVTGLRVTAIEAQHVLFSRAGQTVRVELKPFQARAPVSQTKPTGSGTDAAQAAPSGNSSGAVSTGSSVIGDLEKLMPLLKEAAANAAGADAASGSAAAGETNKTSGTDKTAATKNGNRS